MNFDFSEVIRKINAEIPMEDIGSVIQWCDGKFDGSWSKTIDAMEAALLSKDYSAIMKAKKVFVESQVDLVKRYKMAKQIDEAGSFLASLKQENPFDETD